MPRSCGLMRPSAVTAAASVSTSAAPPPARLPRWTRCQSLAKPASDEYWHIGETRTRWASSRERSLSGSKRWGMWLGGSLWLSLEAAAHLPGRQTPLLGLARPRALDEREKFCIGAQRDRLQVGILQQDESRYRPARVGDH